MSGLNANSSPAAARIPGERGPQDARSISAQLGLLRLNAERQRGCSVVRLPSRMKLRSSAVFSEA